MAPCLSPQHCLSPCLLGVSPTICVSFTCGRQLLASAQAYSKYRTCMYLWLNGAWLRRRQREGRTVSMEAELEYNRRDPE